jgi:hypothetical protein
MLKNLVGLFILLLLLVLNIIIIFQANKLLENSKSFSKDTIFDNSKIEFAVNSALKYVNYSYKKIESLSFTGYPDTKNEDIERYDDYKTAKSELENLKSLSSNQNLKVNLFFKKHHSKIYSIYYLIIFATTLNILVFIITVMTQGFNRK